MKKFLKVIGIIFLVIAILCGIYLLIVFGYKKLLTTKNNQSLMNGVSIETAKEKKEEWKNTPSDIEGMTLWDKYKAGLSVADGSDTDRDGLSDKEEIEEYGSDPLKMSTSGDLYSDLYKVERGMDISKYYKYEGEYEFQYNECDEVSLEALIPTDFNAVVKTFAEEGELAGCKIFSHYQIYNFGGKVTFDLTTILKENGVETSDIKVYVSDGKDIKDYKFTTEDNSITLKKEFSSEYTYDVYITKKDFTGSIMVRFASSFELVTTREAGEETEGESEEETEEEITGAGLVIDSPILTLFLRKPIIIYYEDLGDEDKSEVFKEQLSAHAVDFVGAASDVDSNAVSKFEIDIMYELLNNFLPQFNMTNVSKSSPKLRHFLFMYYSYEDKLIYEAELSEQEEGEAGEETEEEITAFSIQEHTLPFGNFKSEYGTAGNCAGISHLTAYLYNKGTYIGVGEFTTGNTTVAWNIEGDPENATLLDRGLFDYKTSTFVKENGLNGEIDMRSLSEGEQEFIKLIGAAYNEGNKRANDIYTNVYGGDNATIEYDYALVEAMTEFLDSGKILDVYFRMVDGSGHAVNIYGYEADPENSDVIWFYVYDSNFPQNDTGSHTLSEYGFRLRVEKRVNSTGDGYTIAYDYFPINNDEYGATSNKSISENGFMIVMDEEWQILND